MGLDIEAARNGRRHGEAGMTLPAFERWHPIGQALAVRAFMWAVTALGAALVIWTKHVRRKTIDSMEGFAAGVMLAASYWSLLAPELDFRLEEAVRDGFSPHWGLWPEVCASV